MHRKRSSVDQSFYNRICIVLTVELNYKFLDSENAVSLSDTGCKDSEHTRQERMKHQAPKISFDTAISTRPKETAKTTVEGTIPFYYYNNTYYYNVWLVYANLTV